MAEVRPFRAEDAAAVRALFVRVNRLLAPPDMAAAFEAYIVRSLAEEIDDVAGYYGARNGGFWVAIEDGRLAGMFGLEPAGDGAMELRRMYVDPDLRRRGIALMLLDFAEREVKQRGCGRMVLSTSELQDAALSLYRASGYRQVREEIAEAASNKTLGGGIRRFHFEKLLP